MTFSDELLFPCAGEDEKNKTEKSTLYLVTTPIGNLSDLSPRALKMLSECDFIAAEDTRNTLRLLTHFGIRRELVSYHEHNKALRGPEICDRLAAGECCALVTDAGMPAISDPGEDIVRLCAERGIAVTAVPGTCAAVTALSLSALSTGRFVFEGFLPVPKKERTKRLAEVAREERTVILYEAPHRLERTLADLCGVLPGERRISLCRELTKRNEEICRTTLAGALSGCSEKAPRGEYVLILEGGGEYAARKPESHAENSLAADTVPEETPAEAVTRLEAAGFSHKDAIKAAAVERGMSKSAFYDLLIEQKNSADNE